VPSDATSASLHELTANALRGMQSQTHREINEVLQRLGLPAGEGSKRERLDQVIESLQDEDLPKITAQLLAEPQVSKSEKHAIQDALWAGENPPELPTRTRRELAQSLDLDDLTYDADRFRAALGRWWLLGDDDPMIAISALLGVNYPGRNLAEDIDQHVLRFRDWSTAELFSKLGAFTAVGTRFARFLEDLVSAETVPDEPTQRRIVEAANPHLRRVGFELLETDTEEGYPVFSLVATGAARNRAPKNLIFASLTKPDLRFRSAVDNDIEIASNPDDVLIYDRPIPADGLRWCDLQAWWRETRRSPTDQDAKEDLYARLKAALPPKEVSPPQRNLFDAYHAIHGAAIPALPALLPEVWLHWDPKTVRERGRDALLRFRMDFLLLLPNRQRVVLEVDGAHHYSRSGRADGGVYAATVRGDRDLKLAGYEVFRFGAEELINPQAAHALLTNFFAELFRRFRVSPAPGL
jgi:very-short-patch-repair endonuclease